MIIEDKAERDVLTAVSSTNRKVILVAEVNQRNY